MEPMETSALIELIGMLAELFGTLLIAYAALSVHHRFRHEHKVDDAVFRAMSIEIKLGIFGMGLIIFGFIIQIYSRFHGL